jgi:hypothetical protein
MIVVDSPVLSRETFPPPPEYFPSPDYEGLLFTDRPRLSRQTFPPPTDFFPSPDYKGLAFVDSPPPVGIRGYRGEGVIYGITAANCLVRCYGHITGELEEQVMSDAEGFYRITNLVPGRPYDLRYGHIPGHNDLVHTGVIAEIDP